MKKALLLLVILIAAVATGCRHRAKPVAAPSPQVAETAPAPPPTPAPVEPPSQDFAAPRAGGEEVLSSDITELNRIARERGWIDDAFFDYDSFVLSESGRTALTQSAQWLISHPGYALNIEGHCDERGTEQYNLALGDRRANTARTYLLSLGVDGNRLTTLSYGEERPFAEGTTEEAWAQNRRAHLVLGPRSQKAPM